MIIKVNHDSPTARPPATPLLRRQLSSATGGWPGVRPGHDVQHVVVVERQVPLDVGAQRGAARREEVAVPAGGAVVGRDGGGRVRPSSEQSVIISLTLASATPSSRLERPWKLGCTGRRWRSRAPRCLCGR